jgi:hypothetical protein
MRKGGGKSESERWSRNHIYFQYKTHRETSEKTTRTRDRDKFTK